MSAPSYESVSSRNIDETATQTPSVSKPSGTSSGDLLLLFLCYNDTGVDSGEPDSITFPTGFQVIKSSMRTSERRHFIAYKIAGGSEPSSYDLTLTSASHKAQISILRFSNVDSIAPISDIIEDDFSGGDSGRFDGPAITATANQAAVRFGVINDNIDSTISADSGVTLIVNEDTTTGDDTTVVIGVDDSTYTSGASVPAQGFASTAADSTRMYTLLLNGPSTVVAATPVLESQTTHNGLTGGGVSAGGPFSIAKPAGVEEGDLLIGMFVSAANTISMDGFTNLSQVNNSPDTYSHLIAHKYATASEPSTYTVSVDENFYVCGFIVRVSNVDSSTPFADSDIGSEITNNWSYPATTPASKSLIIRGVFDDNDSIQEKRFNIACGGQMFFAQDGAGQDKSARIFTEPYSVVTGNQPLRNDAGGSKKIPFTLAINPDPSAGSSTHIQRTLLGVG